MHILTDNALLEQVRTAVAMHNAASRQPVSNYVSEHEKLASDITSLDVAYRKYRADSDDKNFGLQTTFVSKKRRVNEEAKDHKRILEAEKGLKRRFDTW